jgi:N-acetylmuramoyl-L-alanine amidase
MKRVAVDDGHGLETAGKRTPVKPNGIVVKENEFNYATKIKLMEALKRCGIEAVDVAPGQIDHPLAERVNRANAAKVDAFISIHYNALDGVFDNKKSGGIETYHFTASVEGRKLAEKVHSQLIKGTVMPNRGIKEAGFYVLRHTNMPAVLVECGFMDVLSQAVLMRDENYQRECAEEMCQGICEYLQVPYIGYKGNKTDYEIENWLADMRIKAGPNDIVTFKDLYRIFGMDYSSCEDAGKEFILKNYYEYSKVGTTDIVEVEPLALKHSLQDKAASLINLDNFVTGGYQWHISSGETYPLGIMVSEGKIISNRQPHGVAAGTLIIYKDGKVAVKPVLNILEEKDVWFAVSGCSILPDIRMKEEGFVGSFADIGREASRPVIGYNPVKNKIIIAVRQASNIARGQQTLKNLGCTMGITLDAGGSTAFRVDKTTYFSTNRRLYSVITW